MEASGNVSFVMAFVTGFFAFLSPCILPLIPSYISYLTGVSFSEFRGELTPDRKRQIKLLTLMHAISFIVGFSVIFIALGASITYIGKFVFDYQPILKKVGGVLIIIFGFIIMGVIKIPFLEREKRITYKRKSISILGSFLVGATFAAAWTPCVGPILGSILIYASSSESIKVGIKLLIAFSMGLGLPFLLSALAINSFLAYIKKIEKFLRPIMIVAVIVLVIFGVMLLTGRGII